MTPQVKMKSCHQGVTLHYAVVNTDTWTAYVSESLSCLFTFGPPVNPLRLSLLLLCAGCRIGNLLVPNDNYCKFEDWLMPILDQLLLEQNTQVSLR